MLPRIFEILLRVDLDIATRRVDVYQPLASLIISSNNRILYAFSKTFASRQGRPAILLRDRVVIRPQKRGALRENRATPMYSP